VLKNQKQKKTKRKPQSINTLTTNQSRVRGTKLQTQTWNLGNKTENTQKHIKRKIVTLPVKWSVEAHKRIIKKIKGKTYQVYS
jgi:hypothetical protein